jgi:hypothetical protein
MDSGHLENSFSLSPTPSTNLGQLQPTLVFLDAAEVAAPTSQERSSGPELTWPAGKHAPPTNLRSQFSLATFGYPLSSIKDRFEV